MKAVASEGWFGGRFGERVVRDVEREVLGFMEDGLTAFMPEALDFSRRLPSVSKYASARSATSWPVLPFILSCK